MAGPASSATQQHVLGSVDARGKIGAAANVRMHALDQAAMRRTDVVLAGAFPEAPHGEGLLAGDVGGRSTRRRLARVAPVGTETAVEIGFEDLQRIGVARTLAVQVEQLAVSQALERAAGETAGENRAADIAAGMIEPGLQEGGTHFGTLAATRRAEAARRTAAQRPRDEAGQHQPRRSEQ